MSSVAAVGTGNFKDEVLQAGQPVIVDFTAEWCPPCRALAPVFDKLATQFNGQVKFVKCDIDQNEDLAAQYGVMKIPNLLFFKDGQIVNQAVGSISEAQLSAKAQELLGA